MKNPNRSSVRRGFTLVELLVVITIIAILAGLSFAGITAALKKARTTESKVLATSLKQAIDAFYSEYNKLPDIEAGAGGVETDAGDGLTLLRILLAQESESGDLENKRSVVFLNAKQAKAERGGVEYGSGGGSVEGMYDAFGNPFRVFMNVDYEDELVFSYGGKSYRLRGEQAAVASPGADMEAGNSDDVLTFTRQ